MLIKMPLPLQWRYYENAMVIKMPLPFWDDIIKMPLPLQLWYYEKCNGDKNIDYNNL